MMEGDWGSRCQRRGDRVGRSLLHLMQTCGALLEKSHFFCAVPNEASGIQRSMPPGPLGS